MSCTSDYIGWLVDSRGDGRPGWPLSRLYLAVSASGREGEALLIPGRPRCHEFVLQAECQIA